MQQIFTKSFSSILKYSYTWHHFTVFKQILLKSLTDTTPYSASREFKGEKKFCNNKTIKVCSKNHTRTISWIIGKRSGQKRSSSFIVYTFFLLNRKKKPIFAINHRKTNYRTLYSQSSTTDTRKFSHSYEKSHEWSGNTSPTQ